MKRILIFPKAILCLISFFVLCAFSAAAAEPHSFFGPLLTRSQNPLFLEFLSLVPAAAESLPAGKKRVSVQTVHSNLFERESKNPGAAVDLDMEIWRTSFTLNYGLPQEFELFVEVPFLVSGGGFLDAFIQNYHDTFGFPNGGRENVANGRFAYTVSSNGTPIYAVSEANWIPSDWTVAVKKPIYRHGDCFALAVQHLLKLPVGDRESGGGSGRPDAGVSFIGSYTRAWFQSTTQAGFLFLGGHSELEPILYNQSLQFAQTFEFQILKTLSAVAQLQGGTPMFKNTQNDTLGVMPLDLTIGFEGKAFQKGDRFFFWQFGFSEDALSNGPSVDFSTTMRVGYEF